MARRAATLALSALALLRSPETACAQPVCGAGTALVDVAGTDTCLPTVAAETGDIYLAGIFDDGRASSGYAAWTKHHFELAVDMLNDKTDGFHDDLFTNADGTSDGTTIRTEYAYSGCDEALGAGAYWGVRESADGGRPVHGVIGARCSGPSKAIARIAQLEGVPQVSMSATSPQLSEVDDFRAHTRDPHYHLIS